MNHKNSWDHIIFWSSILTLLVISQKTNGILTDSNALHCTHIQCPKKCPEDSYLKSALDEEDEVFEDYEDEILGHDPYIEELDNFEELPPLEELHDDRSPQHMLKERQKREVFFQEDIEKCCDDQKCVCNKCQDVPKCVEGHVAVEIQEGQGVPGNCCSIFRCVKKEKCQLGLKQAWWTNKCTKCSCFGENELCMQICPEEEILQNCYSEYRQKPMMNGAFWKEGSCTSCSCEQGERRCFTPVCPKLDCKETIKLEEECCPQCLHDDIDVRSEKTFYDENADEDEYVTESTTLETPLVKLKEEHNSTLSQSHSSIPVVEENLAKETQTTSPFVEISETSTALVISESTSEKSSESPTTTSLSTSNTTLSAILANAATTVARDEELLSKQQTQPNYSITLNTTTEGPTSIMKNLLASSPNSTSTEEYKSVEIQATDFSKTTGKDEKVSLTTSTENLEDINTKATTIPDNLPQTNTTQESSFPTSITYSTELTTTTRYSTTNPTELPSSVARDSSTEVNHEFTTIADATDSPVTFSTVSSTSAASRTTSSFIFSTSATSSSSSLPETTTTNMISSSFTTPQASITYTPPDLESTPIATTSSTPTEPQKSSSTSTSTVYLTSSSTSTLTEYLTSSSTSTSSSSTSSPYSTSSVFTTTLLPEESTAKPSTTSPEPFRPLFQSYGDFATDDRTSSSTQNQMRIMFDEIDYVVMIVLFIGSLLCISLGLIIRHTKNRKKMYSSIPNSETSLSQTSTNTVLTV